MSKSSSGGEDLGKSGKEVMKLLFSFFPHSQHIFPQKSGEGFLTFEEKGAGIHPNGESTIWSLVSVKMQSRNNFTKDDLTKSRKPKIFLKPQFFLNYKVVKNYAHQFFYQFLFLYRITERFEELVKNGILNFNRQPYRLIHCFLTFWN